MTTARTFHENEGAFEATVDTDMSCRVCSAVAVKASPWSPSDGGSEDTKFTCTACGHVWWVDGPDA